MNIILDVFKELLFIPKEKFLVECVANSMNVEVTVLISNENNCQVFLIFECDDAQLKNVVDGELIKEIAFIFRKKEYHKAEMDRNTSLLIVSKHPLNEGIDVSSKVKIEDDPYYFKKYVFSYSQKELEAANNWVNKNKKDETTVSLIQNYITDTIHFAKFKKNNAAEPIYTFFIELVTKLHCFPMKTAETKNIKNVDSFLEEELEKLRTKKKKAIDIDKEVIEKFVSMDIDFENEDNICENWNSLFELGNEGVK